MSSFLVHVLGVGDAFSEVYNPSALLLEYNGFFLAIDCPDMYRKVLRSAKGRVPIERIDHFLITHLHGDHMNGIEGAAFYKRFVQKKKITLITSAQAWAQMWQNRLSGSMSRLFDGTTFVDMKYPDYFDTIPLAWSSETTVGPFKIRATPTRHHITTSALTIEAGGRVLGYSSDTAFELRILTFLQDADLIVHETNIGPAHTPYESLACLSEALRKKMRLIHYPDGFSQGDSNIKLLEQGEVLTV